MFIKLEPVATIEYIIAFIICLICFLIGYFFARSYYKRNRKKEIIISAENNEALKKSVPVQEEKIEVKAVKTRGRSGEAIPDETFLLKGVKSSNKKAKPHINFGNIGVADASQKDDLKRISGVGPFIEKKLNSIEIYTFKQISRFSDHDMETVTKLIEFFPGRIKRDDWKGQAITLLEEKETK